MNVYALEVHLELTRQAHERTLRRARQAQEVRAALSAERRLPRSSRSPRWPLPWRA